MSTGLSHPPRPRSPPMDRPRRAMSVSAAHALHFQIPKMATPTPPSLLKRQQSASPSVTPMPRMSPRPASPRSPTPVPRSPRPDVRASPRPPSPRVQAVRSINEYEATFRAARIIAAAAN